MTTEGTKATFLVKELKDLPEISKEIIKFAEQLRVWAFYGEMGAGKTTLIKAICKQLGVEDNVSSPTFAIVNEYCGNNENVYHFDFYRLKDEKEAFDIGIGEYFYSGNYCLIEWPSRIENAIPESRLEINISEVTNSERLIQLTKK